MNLDFEELAFSATALGELSLRKRAEPRLNGRIVFEVKLGDEFLMSSLFTTGEIALADLGLAPCTGDTLEVVVGGLGLGYTAQAALANPQVDSLLVVDALAEVIDWHRRGLVPLGAALVDDRRCRLVEGDFFSLANSGFDTAYPGRRFHAVLLDIDHSPVNVLHPSHGNFYTVEGLERLSAQLHPEGVFALWSNDPPDEAFCRILGTVFRSPQAHVVKFHNPYTQGESACTVYVAKYSPGAGESS